MALLVLVELAVFTAASSVLLFVGRI